MKLRVYTLLTVLLLGLVGCSHHSDSLAGHRTSWRHKKKPTAKDNDLFARRYGGDEEFIPLDEGDLNIRFVDSAIPQPKIIPGAPGSGLPSLDLFKKALADLAHIFQNVYFNTDEYVVRSPEYMQIIDRIAGYLQKHPNTFISINGHCDERGSESYNLALGTRRSNYIRSLLVERGVDPDHIHSISYGKEQPSDFGHTPSAWAHNRRVEFKLYEKE